MPDSSMLAGSKSADTLFAFKLRFIILILGMKKGSYLFLN